MIHLSPLDPEMPLDMMESDLKNFYAPEPRLLVEWGEWVRRLEDYEFAFEENEFRNSFSSKRKLLVV